MLSIIAASEVAAVQVLDVHVPHDTGTGPVLCSIPGLVLSSHGAAWLVPGETYYLGTNRTMTQWLVTGGSLPPGELHQLVTASGEAPATLPTTLALDVRLEPAVYTLTWTEDDDGGHWTITATRP